MRDPYSLSHLSDADLLRRMAELVAAESAAEAALIAHFAEVDARQLHLPEHLRHVEEPASQPEVAPDGPT